MPLLYFLAFIVSAVTLARSSLSLVNTLTKLALKFRVSEFLVGFVVMAIATSLPELLVGIVSAVEGEPLLSLGNVIGSNIADLSIVVGLAAITARGVRLQSQVRNRETIFMNLFALAPLLLLLDGQLGRGEGVLLLMFFGFYMYNLVLRSPTYTKVMKDRRRDFSLSHQLLLLLGGLIVLLVSAEVLIRSGVSLAHTLGIPPLLVGLFALAIGTSLPELSFEVSAATKHCGEMLIGNIMGSVVANSTLVLGITALISPITPERPDILGTSAVFLAVTLLTFTIFARSQYKVSLREGLVLVLGYLVFVVAELLFGTLR